MYNKNNKLILILLLVLGLSSHNFAQQFEITQLILDDPGSDCSGSVLLSGSPEGGPYNVVIEGDGTVTENTNGIIIVENLCEGQTQITLTNALGCKQIISVDLTDACKVYINNAKIENSSGCMEDDGSILIKYYPLGYGGGNGPYTFSWNNGTTDKDLENIGPGTYILTVTDSEGCTATKDFSIESDNGELDIFATIENTCKNTELGKITVVATGALPISFEWGDSPGNIDNSQLSGGVSSVSNLPAGAHWVTITTATGCSGNYSFNVGTNYPDPLTLEITNVKASCPNDDSGSLDIIVEGGLLPTIKQGPGGWSLFSTKLNNLAPGSYVFEIEDACGQNVTETVVIDEHPALTIDVETETVCTGEGYFIVKDIIGGVAPYQVSSVGANFSGLGYTIKVSPGDYVVKVKDAAGCEFSKVVTVEEFDPLELNIEKTNYCYDEDVDLGWLNTGSIKLNPKGGEPPYNIVWNDENIPTGTTSLENLQPKGSTSYKVTITDSEGCSKKATVILDNKLITGVDHTECKKYYKCNGGAINYYGNDGIPGEETWVNCFQKNIECTIDGTTYTSSIYFPNGCFPDFNEIDCTYQDLYPDGFTPVPGTLIEGEDISGVISGEKVTAFGTCYYCYQLDYCLVEVSGGPNYVSINTPTSEIVNGIEFEDIGECDSGSTKYKISCIYDPTYTKEICVDAEFVDVDDLKCEPTKDELEDCIENNPDINTDCEPDEDGDGFCGGDDGTDPNDNNPCVPDVNSPACDQDCTPGEACDDGDPCTIDEYCDENGDCVGGIVIDEDGDGLCGGDDDYPNDPCLPNNPCPDGTTCENGVCITDQELCDINEDVDEDDSQPYGPLWFSELQEGTFLKVIFTVGYKYSDELIIKGGGINKVVCPIIPEEGEGKYKADLEVTDGTTPIMIKVTPNCNIPLEGDQETVYKLSITCTPPPGNINPHEDDCNGSNNLVGTDCCSPNAELIIDTNPIEVCDYCYYNACTDSLLEVYVILDEVSTPLSNFPEFNFPYCDNNSSYNCDFDCGGLPTFDVLVGDTNAWLASNGYQGTAQQLNGPATCKGYATPFWVEQTNIEFSTSYLWEYNHTFDYEVGYQVHDSNQSNCNGSSGDGPIAQVIDACEGAEYLWSTGETTESIPYIQGDKYSVTITCPDGCTTVKKYGYDVGTSRIINEDASSLDLLSEQSEVSTREATLNEFKVFPVPTNNALTLEFNSKIEGEVSFMIFSGNGNLVEEMQFNSVEGKNARPINVTHLAPGVYVTKLVNNSISYGYQRIVIIK